MKKNRRAQNEGRKVINKFQGATFWRSPWVWSYHEKTLASKRLEFLFTFVCPEHPLPEDDAVLKMGDMAEVWSDCGGRAN